MQLTILIYEYVSIETIILLIIYYVRKKLHGNCQIIDACEINEKGL